MTARMAATTARSNGVCVIENTPSTRIGSCITREDGAQRQSPGVEAQDDVERDQHQRHRQRHDGASCAVHRPPADRPPRACVICARRIDRLRARSRTSGAPGRPVCAGRLQADADMSRAEPKCCTCGSWKPAAIDAPCAPRHRCRPAGKCASTDDAAGEVDGEVQAAHEERREATRSSARSTACTTPCAWP